MGIAVNLWGWTPGQFMDSTAHEFAAAHEVYREINKRPEGG